MTCIELAMDMVHWKAYAKVIINISYYLEQEIYKEELIN